jgi:hypothetical protein
MSDPSRSEFGDFLRSRRAKLNPKGTSNNDDFVVGDPAAVA